METLGSGAVRSRLPELPERARRGEQTVIQRHGVAVAALAPRSRRLRPSRPSLLALRGRGCWRQETSELVDALRQEWD